MLSNNIIRNVRGHSLPTPRVNPEKSKKIQSYRLQNITKKTQTLIYYNIFFFFFLEKFIEKCNFL